MSRRLCRSFFCGWSVVAVVAGGGALFGQSGMAAEFDYPISVAVAADGTVFVGDLNMPGIRKVADGQVSVVFQADKKFRTPLNRVRCIALDAKGQLLAGDTSTRQVYRFNAEGAPEPLLKGLGIGMPMALAPAPNGDLYVADLELHRIWKAPADGSEQTLFAEVPAPRGLFLDKEGRLWVVSHGKNQLVRIGADGTVEPIVKDRIFDFPHNVVVDDQMNAYITDGYSKAVWRVPAGGEPEKWVSGEPFVNPVGLTWLGSDLLVADPRAPGLFRVGMDKLVTPLELKPAP